MALNLFIYPQVEKSVHDTIEGFYGTTPFGGDGIKDHFIITEDPKEVDLFWMGQYKDVEEWKLHPNRFPHLQKYPDKHVVELEGDWRDLRFPHWLHDCLIITGNWNLDRYGMDWKIFVRPIMSPLLIKLVKDPPEYKPPTERKFWFRGQRDGFGVRDKLHRALETAGVPYEFEFNDKWMVYADEDDPLRLSYVESMKRNAFALCPRGEGQATCRFYEAAAFGRPAVVVANNLLFGNCGWPLQISENESVGSMADSIRRLWTSMESEGLYRNRVAYSRNYFSEIVQSYFRDPTQAFLDWREKHFTAEK